MSLDDLSLDSGEGVGASNEAPSEKSEKQKEQSRKAQAQLQKTQKDEKKAKTDNDELFYLLSRFIRNPLYDELIPTTIELLQNEFPSRFLLPVIALVFPEASHYLLEKTDLPEKKSLLLNLYHSPERVIFDDRGLHSSLRDWITTWLTATERFLISQDASTVLTQKLFGQLEGDGREGAKKSLATFFRYFFISRNIELSPEKAQAYVDHILHEMQDSLRDHLVTLDIDLRMEQAIDAKDLF